MPVKESDIVDNLKLAFEVDVGACAVCVILRAPREVRLDTLGAGFLYPALLGTCSFYDSARRRYSLPGMNHYSYLSNTNHTRHTLAVATG